MATTTLPLPPRAQVCFDIHPIFAYDNWVALDPTDYDLLRTALQLATMYLKTPACLNFYATLLFSERTAEALDDKWIICIEKESPLTTYKAEQIRDRDKFNEIAGLYKVCFKEISSHGFTEPGQWRDLTVAERTDLERRQRIEKPPAWSARMSLKHGVTVDQLDRGESEFCFDEFPGLEPTHPDEDRKKVIQDPRTLMTPCMITLKASLLSYIKSDGFTMKDALRMDLYLAVTLLHELAHAVEMGRPEVRESEGRREVDEAIFPGEDFSELGWQFETSVIGGAVCIFDDDFLTITDWPIKPTSLRYNVSIEFLIGIQWRNFWTTAHDRASPDPSQFKVPKLVPREDSAELSQRCLDEWVDKDCGS